MEVEKNVRQVEEAVEAEDEIARFEAEVVMVTDTVKFEKSV